MDRPPHQHGSLTDLFAKPDSTPALAETAETDVWSDPWNVSSEEATLPPSTQDIRQVYLKGRTEARPSPGVAMPHLSKLRTMASQMKARIPSRLRFDRRVAAGVGLFGVTCALLVAVSRFDFSPAMKTVSGTTNTTVARLASAVDAALDWVNPGPASPVATEDAASTSRNKVPDGRTNAKRGPIDSTQALQLTPLVGAEAVHANGPAPVGNADVNAAIEVGNHEAPAPPPSDSAVEAPVIIYSLDDADVSPPVAIRAPGIAAERADGDKNVSSIEILVNETGGVEAVRGRPRPATLGAALHSATALSVVKTWRFRPARRNGQPVKYRTTVTFFEPANPAGTTDGAR